MHQSIGTKLCPKPFWSSLINDILGEIWKFTNFLESWPLSRCLCSIFWDESEPKSTSAVRVGCLSPMKSTCALSFMLTQLLLHRKPFLLFEWLSYSDLLFGWLFFFFWKWGKKACSFKKCSWQYMFPVIKCELSWEIQNLGGLFLLLRPLQFAKLSATFLYILENSFS